jgi:hypothetical protein
MKPLRDALHTDSLVSDDQTIQDVSTADASPAVEAKMSFATKKIVKNILHQQSSTSWTRHSAFLLLKALAA